MARRATEIVKAYGEVSANSVLLKYYDGALKIDELTTVDKGLLIKASKAAVLETVDEKGEPYHILVLVDENGDMYKTSSAVVMDLIEEVWPDMEFLRSEGMGEGIYFYKRPSKNNAGDMILCRPM